MKVEVLLLLLAEALRPHLVRWCALYSEKETFEILNLLAAPS